MSGFVHFRAGGTDYAIDVEATRRVLAPDGLEPAPDPVPGVAGLLRKGSFTYPVLDLLGAAGAARVLEVEAAGRRFGLAADEVVAVLPAERVAVGPPPAGQHGLVAGVATAGDLCLMLLDATELAARLDSP